MILNINDWMKKTSLLQTEGGVVILLKVIMRQKESVQHRKDYAKVIWSHNLLRLMPQLSEILTRSQLTHVILITFRSLTERRFHFQSVIMWEKVENETFYVTLISHQWINSLMILLFIQTRYHHIRYAHCLHGHRFIVIFITTII